MPTSRPSQISQAWRWPRLTPRARRSRPEDRQGDEGVGRLRHGQGDELEQRMQPASGRLDERRDQAEDPGQRRPGPAARRRIRRRRGVTSTGGGQESPWGKVATTAGCSSFDPRSVASGWGRASSRSTTVAAGQVLAAVEEADVELVARLELDPGHLAVGQEQRRHPEAVQPRRGLGDHLAGAAGVGVEAGAEVGQLGVAGVAGDEAGVAGGDQVAGQGPGRLVGVVAGRRAG